jgi:DNA-binding NtrC family response regulator
MADRTLVLSDSTVILPSVLLVSKNAAKLATLCALGESSAWRVEVAGSGWEALERVQTGHPAQLVLLDFAAGDADGLHTLRWLRRVRPDLPVVVIAESEEESGRVEAARLGAQEYLTYAAESSRLKALVERYLQPQQLESEFDLANDEIEKVGEDMFFIAASPAMHKVRSQAQLLAQTDAPLLLVGEPGTGKEVVAALIHKLSVRSGFRFGKVYCDAYPGDLLEMELFGTDRASFAGTVRVKPGRFELCQKGVLFLNEITEMPVGVQSKTLQVMQERQFVRPPETRVPVDVRLMATTSANLDEALADGRLREDLYFRLSAFTVYVPALRQRREEIPLLLGHFMSQLARQYNLPPRTFTAAMRTACQHHTWPGNLNELKDFVKRYLVVGDEDLAIRELEKNTRQYPTRVTAPAPSLEPAQGFEMRSHSEPSVAGSLKTLIRDVKGEAERQAIASALEQTGWNRKAAARLLKVSYRTLLYKIQQYRMSPPEPLAGPSMNGGGSPATNGDKRKSNGWALEPVNGKKWSSE